MWPFPCRSSLTCPHCLKQSNTFDPFLCISLPIPLRQTRWVYSSSLRRTTLVFVCNEYNTSYLMSCRCGSQICPGHCGAEGLVPKRKTWWKTLSAQRNNVLFTLLSLLVGSTGVNLFRKSGHFQPGRLYFSAVLNKVTFWLLFTFLNTHNKLIVFVELCSSRAWLMFCPRLRSIMWTHVKVASLSLSKR